MTNDISSYQLLMTVARTGAHEQVARHILGCGPEDIKQAFYLAVAKDHNLTALALAQHMKSPSDTDISIFADGLTKACRDFKADVVTQWLELDPRVSTSSTLMTGIQASIEHDQCDTISCLYGVLLRQFPMDGDEVGVMKRDLHFFDQAVYSGHQKALLTLMDLFDKPHLNTSYIKRMAYLPQTSITPHFMDALLERFGEDVMESARPRIDLGVYPPFWIQHEAAVQRKALQKAVDQRTPSVTTRKPAKM